MLIQHFAFDVILHSNFVSFQLPDYPMIFFFLFQLPRQKYILSRYFMSLSIFHFSEWNFLSKFISRAKHTLSSSSQENYLNFQLIEISCKSENLSKIDLVAKYCFTKFIIFFRNFQYTEESKLFFYSKITTKKNAKRNDSSVFSFVSWSEMDMYWLNYLIWIRFSVKFINSFCDFIFCIFYVCCNII